MGLAAEIEACERAVWQALIDGDVAADHAALAADFLGVYPDGFAGRGAHADQLSAGPTLAGFVLSDLRVRQLGPDHALISYLACYNRSGRDGSEAMYVSSIWQCHAAGWQNIFSQDTPATGISLP
ncbi:MAG: nuclear transport factor 2 family protein [Rhodobacteraceae bacterium]|jgi:hypothetical protein|nr:nuclear transport factor 2 family protein [Paracoccaceae bacterium]